MIAAGAYPTAIAPLPSGRFPSGDAYMEDHHDLRIRATFDAALGGRLIGIDLLVLSRAWDEDLELFYYLKEVVRLGRGAAIPPLHLFDLLHGRGEANRDYGLARLRELVGRLAAATGAGITADALRAAIVEVNAQREATRRLLERRRLVPAGVTGVEALHLIGAGRFMRPVDHAALLNRHLDATEPIRHAGPRLLVVSATSLVHDRLHLAIEKAGAVVVAEDDSWGSRAAGRDVSAEGDRDQLLVGILDKYLLDVPSPRLAPAAARDEWLRTTVQSAGLDGVVFHVPATDHWFGWDYPRLRALVEGAGLPSVVVRDDVHSAAGSDAVTESVAGFVHQGVGDR